MMSQWCRWFQILQGILLVQSYFKSETCRKCFITATPNMVTSSHGVDACGSESIAAFRPRAASGNGSDIPMWGFCGATTKHDKTDLSQSRDRNRFARYPLVNIYITMENHHFSWEYPLFLWQCSIAMLYVSLPMFTRGYLQCREREPALKVLWTAHPTSPPFSVPNPRRDTSSATRSAAQPIILAAAASPPYPPWCSHNASGPENCRWSW